MGHEIADCVGPRAATPILRSASPSRHGRLGLRILRMVRLGPRAALRGGRRSGLDRDGGFAEFVLVPHRRHSSSSATSIHRATPFGCAALCAYAAVSRTQPFLDGAATLVVIGVGGLGQFAVQFARRLAARIVAVDLDPDASGRA